MKTSRKLEPRKRPTQERARHTVDAILQATTYILVEAGYETLTTNRIAERAGVNIATLYQYFPDKETVVAEIARRHVAETRAAALSVLASRKKGGGLEATVRPLIESVIAAHRVQPALHRVLTQQAMRLDLAPIDAPVDAEMRREEQSWIAQAKDGFEDPELTLWIVKGAIHGLVHQAILDRPRELARPLFVDELTRLVTRFLRRKAPIRHAAVHVLSAQRLRVKKRS